LNPGCVDILARKLHFPDGRHRVIPGSTKLFKRDARGMQCLAAILLEK